MGVQSNAQSFTLYIIPCLSIYYATIIDTGRLDQSECKIVVHNGMLVT